MAVRIESQSEPIPGYTLIDRLGSGGFGEVWKCEAPGGIFKAIKVIHGDLRSKDNDLIRYAEQELKALKRVKMVRHPYLLALDRYDIVDGKLLITMELADCNLWDRFRECRNKGLPGIPRDELLLYMAESAEVLDLMNDQYQLQHLDIKPQNLFMLHNHVKVADFGQVKDLEGVLANVTGGITPVYAAPETFDGIVSRYCDQYSLACVYQELLTGTRPFDGSSMSQLLMQHLQLPPNLKPSPPCDRPALERALAKKADDRWPSCGAFVRALKDGGEATARAHAAAQAAAHTYPAGEPRAAEATPAGPSVGSDTPRPRLVDAAPPIYTPAPPEFGGTGPLQPTLIVGVGQSGLRVIQRFRYELEERYGSVDHTPVVRSVYLDTDPDTLDDAQVPRPLERLAALRRQDVLEARLNRAGHYLKPRMNGRSLIEGWFDPALLYKIPRNPSTMGLRLLGRLAFCDHYRAVMGRLQTELEACLKPESLEATQARTGLDVRTNRPRVYVVAGLSGGTGGGMFLDLAYALRTRLKRLGYETPEIVGLFLVPPADATMSPQQSLGNAYAALTELNHYSRPETAFSAHYDERGGVLREKDAPFSRFYLLPAAVGASVVRHTPLAATNSGSGMHAALRASGPIQNPARTSGVVGNPAARSSGITGQPPARTSGVLSQPGARNRQPSLTPPSIGVPGSRAVPAAGAERPVDAAAGLSALKPYTDAAEFLRLNVFTQLGRLADEARESQAKEAEADGVPRPTVGVGTFGLVVFDWPRGDVVARTAVPVARSLLTRWVAPNGKRAREVVPAWAAAQWSRLGLEPDDILGRFQKAADGVLGCRVDELTAAAVEPILPKGWLARLPEPPAVAVVLDRLVRTFGPAASASKRPPTPLEDAVDQAAVEVAQEVNHELRTLAPGLVEDPAFRLAGAEDVVRQFLATLDRLLERYLAQAADLDNKAVAAHELLLDYTHFAKGSRKPSAAEFTEAVRQFPRCRYQALTARHLIAVYKFLRDGLAGQMSDVTACRQRAEAALATVAPAVSDDMLEVAATVRRLMPSGCATVGDAVERFRKVLGEADLDEIDRRVQAGVEHEYGGIYQACLNSASGAQHVVDLTLSEARAYLETRLGAADLGAMFAERYRTPQAAELVISEAYQQAEPTWVGDGPWSAAGLTVLAAPGGDPSAEGLRDVARRGLPVAGLPTADVRDELTVYREFPAVPFSALPHLGEAGAAAYASLPDVNQCSLHARLDITQWAAADAE